MATIKAIDGRSVHQIQSGQVIVDLCSVVKELVENSFDAGATSVDVKFKNQGLDSIEVQDNGSGISPDNYETVALKHYTSKLSTYADLDTLETFGFRGEALASLCALSKFTIVSCLPSDAPQGTKLEFEMTGKVAGKRVVAAQKGTTVSVEKLFHNLPVRRRELERNIKREWGKVIGLLNQYACIQTGVKFTVSQQPNKGRRIILFSTKGNITTRDNLINVFGAKTLSCLIPLDLKLELEPTKGPHLKPRSANGGGGMTEVNILGHVSRPSPGEGRNTPDRQMFYVNGRPCGLPQFAKTFNETYRSYAPNQSPFVFADIKLDTHLYDVNVSPDKRTVLLHDQGKMLDSLRDALVDLFESQTQTVPVSQPKLSQHLTPFKRPGIFSTDTPTPRGAMPSPAVQTPSTRNGYIQGDEDDAPVASIRQFAAGNVSNTINKQPSTVKLTMAVKGHDDDGEEEEGEGKEMDTESDEEDVGEHIMDAITANPDPKQHTSPLPDRRFTHLQPSQTPQRIKDFHARLAEMRDPSGSLYRQAEEGQASSPPPPTPIASVPPQKEHISPVSNVGSTVSRAPKRLTEEIASITIGDTTITKIIGSQAKRPRIEQSSTQVRATRKNKSVSSTAPLPSFGGRLSQMFAAAATRQAANATSLSATREVTRSEGVGDDGDDDDDDDDDEDEDDGDMEGRMDVDNEEDEEDEEDKESGHTNNKEDEAEESDEDALFVSEKPSRPRGDEMHDDPRPDFERKGKRSIVAYGDLNEPPSHQPDPESEDEEISLSDDEEQDLPTIDDSKDADFLPDEAKKQKEDAKVSELIAQAEAATDSELALKRAESMTKPVSRSKKRNTTVNLVQTIKTTEDDVLAMMDLMNESLGLTPEKCHARMREKELEDEMQDMDDDIEGKDGEEKLESLIIDKSDFEKMQVIGQFNLGFIIALRKGERKSHLHFPSPPNSHPDPTSANEEEEEEEEAEGSGNKGTISQKEKTIRGKRTEDDLFIIDQHASDEKFNFERLQSTTVVASQRLVNPKQLDLTALEEEIILGNMSALEANGFQVHIDASGISPVGRRVQLLSLPLSKEVTFGLDDFEELVVLLGENAGLTNSSYHNGERRLSITSLCSDSELDDSDSHHTKGHKGEKGEHDDDDDNNDNKASVKVGRDKINLDKIPRPSKVRKMFAMRACRSSVMIGRALTKSQMAKLVRQMGGMDKPWNCPHGRPTMRHLAGLGAWDRRVDEEEESSIIDWPAYLTRDRSRRS